MSMETTPMYANQDLHTCNEQDQGSGHVRADARVMVLPAAWISHWSLPPTCQPHHSRDLGNSLWALEISGDLLSTSCSEGREEGTLGVFLPSRSASDRCIPVPA